MVRLAAELIHSILGNIDDRNDLISCRLVSKLFEGAAAPVVWKTLRIRKPRTTGNVERRISFQDLSTTTHISKHVKEIIYDTTELSYPNPIFKDIRQSIEDFSSFPNFQNLSTLRIFFPANGMELLSSLDEGNEDFDFDNYDYLSDEEVTPERKLRSEIFKKLSQLHLGHGFTIENLELSNIFPVPHTGMHAEGLPSFLKSVKSLSISIAEVDSDVETGASPAADDFYMLFKEELTNLLKASTELESLAYNGDRYAHSLTDAQWDSLSYPNLKYLTLGDVVFNNRPPNAPHKVSRFILRHKNTLRELHMRSCLIDAEDISTNVLTWAELFQVFKDNLKKLKEFTFEPLPGRDEQDEDYFRGYAWWDTEGGYSEYFDVDNDDPADTEVDRIALASFQEELVVQRTS